MRAIIWFLGFAYILTDRISRLALYEGMNPIEFVMVVPLVVWPWILFVLLIGLVYTIGLDLRKKI